MSTTPSYTIFVEDEMHFVILEYIASPLLEKSEYSENNTEYRYIII